MATLGLGLAGLTAATIATRFGGVLFLPNLLIAAILGMSSVVIDSTPRSRLWGVPTWAAAGAIAGIAMYGNTGVYFPQIWGTVVGFLLASLLADFRRGRWPLFTAAQLTLSIGVAFLHYLFITWQISVIMRD